MNNAQISNSFRFVTFRKEKYSYTDCRGGSPDHYIAYMRSGHCRIVTAAYTVEIQEGDVFYIPYGIPYQSYWYGDDLICFDSYAFQLFPEFENYDYPMQVIPHNDEILSLINQLTGGIHHTTCAAVGTLYTLLALLLPRMKFNPVSRSHALIKAAEDYLYTHPDARIGELAKQCGSSESGLYAIFRRNAGMTPNELRQKVLTQKAEELLATTDLPVETVSEMLHFSSSSYFRKILKKYTGLTPKEIRKKYSI